MPVSQIPPEILEQLNKYKKHIKDKSCLKCGYVGPMGIKEPNRNFNIFIAIIWAVLFIIFYGFIGLSWIISMGLCLIITLIITKYVEENCLFVCPKCNNGEQEKSTEDDNQSN